MFPFRILCSYPCVTFSVVQFHMLHVLPISHVQCLLLYFDCTKLPAQVTSIVCDLVVASNEAGGEYKCVRFLEFNCSVEPRLN